MKKSSNRQHGAVTVFLSFVMVSIIAFMGMLVDLARMRVAESQVKRASQLAMDSVMSEYSRRLREDYGLFGYAGADADATYRKYLNDNLRPARTQEDGDFLRLLHEIIPSEKPRYGDMLNLQADEGTMGAGEYPLADPAVLYQQVIEFSKFRVPIDMVLHGRLDGISELQREMTEASNENAAYDRMNDIDAPMERYAGSRNELDGAVTALQEAIDALNLAAADWDQLIGGEKTDERIRVRYSAGIELQEVDFETDSYFGRDFVAGATLRDSTREVAYDLSAIPYLLGGSSAPYAANSALAAFSALDEDVRADLRVRVMGGLAEQLRKDGEYLRKKQADFDKLSEGEQTTLNALIERYNSTLKWARELQDQVEINSANTARGVCDQLLSDFRSELAKRSVSGWMAYQSCVSDVRNQMQIVEDKLSSVDEQGEAVDRALREIGDDLNRQRRDEKISEDLVNEWQNGDRADTQKLRDSDDRSIAELRSALASLEQQLDATSSPDSLDPAAVAQSFVNSGVLAVLNGNSSSWDGEFFRVDDALSLRASFTAKDDAQEGKYNDAMSRADERRSEAKNALKELGEQLPEARYNPESIPDAYLQNFLTAAELEDEGGSAGVDDDMKGTGAAKKSEQMNGAFSRLTDMFGNGIQYIIGSVYTAEYILRMFSNAAPAQEENKYDANSFEYARVSTLRNAVPVGLPDYQDRQNLPEALRDAKLRLGYFYNAEVEYILFGGAKERTNVTRAQIMLELLLTMTNYLQVRKSSALKPLVEAAAAAGVYLCIPPSITKTAMYFVFAAIETQFEMFYLMRGYAISPFSRDGNMLFMLHLDDPNPVLSDGGVKLSYESYLQLRLMAALILDYEGVMQRLANLIQLNINYAGDSLGGDAYAADADFRMARAYTTFRGTASASMPYWFMTMAMLDGVLRDGKRFTIPPYEIVSSY